MTEPPTRTIYCFDDPSSVPIMGVFWRADGRVVAVLRDSSAPGAVSWVPIPQASSADALALVEVSRAHGRRIVDSAQ